MNDMSQASWQSAGAILGQDEVDHKKLRKSLDQVIQQKFVQEYLTNVCQEGIDLAKIIHIDL
jgi:hypothetical protein